MPGETSATNGKIERWFGLLEKKLKLFNSVDEFVLWFNTLKPHMSLSLDECVTHEQVFGRKLLSGTNSQLFWYVVLCNCVK